MIYRFRSPLQRFLLFAALCFQMVPAVAQTWMWAPLREGQEIPEKLDLSEGSLLLLPMTFENAYKPGRIPLSITVHVKNLDRSAGGVRAQDFFKFDKFANSSVNEGLYLIALVLKPGNYAIHTINGSTNHFPIRPQFQYSLYIPLNVKEKGGIYYLGQIGIKNIQRTNPKDQASGFLTPLIDQALGGFSDGTLRFQLQDFFSTDVAVYQSKYEVLKPLGVEKALLSAISLEPATASDAGLRIVKMTPNGQVPAAHTELEKIIISRKPTNFAPLEDVNAIPNINEQGRKGYADWLERQSPRAFVISEEGRWNSAYGNRPADMTQSSDPAIRAMRACQMRGLTRCMLYAIDSMVVYQPVVVQDDLGATQTQTQVVSPASQAVPPANDQESINKQ